MIAILAVAIFCYVLAWDPPTWVFLCAGIALGFLIVPVGRRLARRESAEELAHEYLRLGQCPSCGYNLEAIVPDANDLRTCPECGGVWKVPTK
jgi:hypothetical protein